MIHIKKDMKKIFSIVVIALLISSACKAPAPDIDKATEFANALISEMQKQNWDAALEYYDPSESKEDRAAKLMQLHESMGEINSFELLESSSNTDPGQASYTLLSYKIDRSKISSKESFRIINDEGKLMIIQHSIEAMK